MTMPLPLQHDNGLMPSDELQERMSRPEVQGGATFIPASGRVYRLFGNEDKSFSMPYIPEIPSTLAAHKSSAISLEDALQQIETFSSPVKSGSVAEQSNTNQMVLPATECSSSTTSPPTLQLFQALGTVPDQHADLRIPLKLIKGESSVSHVTLSAKDVVREVLQMLPTAAPNPLPMPKDESRQPLRVISDTVEEPFVVPFAKPEPPQEKIKTKNAVLKIVTEIIPPVFFSKVLKKCGNIRRKGNAVHRKRFSLPPISTAPMEELPVVCETQPPVNASAFRWSAQLDSLMQTASNQIRMLTDHLVVQLNQGIKAICFKSVFPGDGCSTILLCAVRALLERHYRILLIDAHHRNIDLPKQLNLSGDMDTGSEVLTINDQLGLWVWQELKSTDENTALLAEVITTHREKYDLILLDDGSVTEIPLTEFVAFWNRVELNGVVLVSNMKHPSEVPMSHIARRLRQHHVPLIGIAENYV